MSVLYELLEKYSDKMTSLERALVLESTYDTRCRMTAIGEDDIPLGWDGEDMIYIQNGLVKRAQFNDATGIGIVSANRLLAAYNDTRNQSDGQALYEEYFWSGKSYDFDFDMWLLKRK